jgi:hypothetical protein
LSRSEELLDAGFWLLAASCWLLACGSLVLELTCSSRIFKKMNRAHKIEIFLLIILGFVVPFIPPLVIIELFYLLIPSVIIFIITLISLIINILNKNVITQKYLLLFSILPIFTISQLTSCFIVDKIQRLRSNYIIAAIEKQKSETGIIPEKYDQIAGIEYIKIKDSEQYLIKYNRGFMVTEEYDSGNKSRISNGWND